MIWTNMMIFGLISGVLAPSSKILIYFRTRTGWVHRRREIYRHGFLMASLPDVRNSITSDSLVYELLWATLKIQLSPVIQMRLHYKFQNVHLKVSTLIGQKHTWPDPTRLPNWMAMIWIHAQVLKMATKLYLGIVIRIELIEIHMNPLCDRETFPFEPKWTILKHSRWY